MFCWHKWKLEGANTFCFFGEFFTYLLYRCYKCERHKVKKVKGSWEIKGEKPMSADEFYASLKDEK